MINVYEGSKALISLPSGLNLYEELASSHIAELIAFVQKLHEDSKSTIKGVLVLQSRPADDFSFSWLAELETTALLYRLTDRVDNIRWLLSLIRHSPVPWVYASKTDCLGSNWELALSCQRRYWFDAEARLGFPDISCGAFPPGGVLESLEKRVGRSKERWSQRPVLTAEQGMLEGYVDFCSYADDLETTAKNLFAEMLRLDPQSGVRDEGRKGKRVAFDMHALAKTRPLALGELALDQLQIAKGESSASGGQQAKAPSAWDYCWQLTRNKRHLKGDRPHELGRLIAYVSAHHYLSTRYRAWLAAELARASAARTLKQVSQNAKISTIVAIDLNFLLPPVAVIAHLLTGGVSLVFIADDAKMLSGALNGLHDRLEKLLGSERANFLWQHLVHWCQGLCHEQIFMTMRWTIDDKLVLTAPVAKELNASEIRRYEFFRVEGHANAEYYGIYEALATQPQPPAGSLELRILRLFVHALIETPSKGVSTMPLMQFIRSAALEEMAKLSAHRDNDIDSVVEGLRQTTWGFCGQEAAWERFVRLRHDLYDYDPELLNVGRHRFDRGLWETGVWKHIKSYVRRQANAGESFWNNTAVSHHMAIYAGILVLDLHARGHCKSLAQLDGLVSASLGFPASCGTPLHYLRQKGQRRIEHYARSYWRQEMKFLAIPEVGDMKTVRS